MSLNVFIEMGGDTPLSITSLWYAHKYTFNLPEPHRNVMLGRKCFFFTTKTVWYKMNRFRSVISDYTPSINRTWSFWRPNHRQSVYPVVANAIFYIIWSVEHWQFRMLRHSIHNSITSVAHTDITSNVWCMDQKLLVFIFFRFPLQITPLIMTCSILYGKKR